MFQSWQLNRDEPKIIINLRPDPKFVQVAWANRKQERTDEGRGKEKSSISKYSRVSLPDTCWLWVITVVTRLCNLLIFCVVQCLLFRRVLSTATSAYRRPLHIPLLCVCVCVCILICGTWINELMKIVIIKRDSTTTTEKQQQKTRGIINKRQELGDFMQSHSSLYPPFPSHRLASFVSSYILTHTKVLMNKIISCAKCIRMLRNENKGFWLLFSGYFFLPSSYPSSTASCTNTYFSRGKARITNHSWGMWWIYVCARETLKVCDVKFNN